MPLDCEWPTPEQIAKQKENDDHFLDLNGVRKAAQENGYDEWFYCECYKGAVLVAAFQKTQKDGDVIKIQVYPKTHAVSVCYFHYSDGENDQEERNERTAYMDGKLKELLSTVKKSLFVSQNVDSVDKFSQILADPLEYGKNLIYTRCNNLNEKWIPSLDPSVKDFCANCNKPPAQGKSLAFSLFQV